MCLGGGRVGGVGQVVGVGCMVGVGGDPKAGYTIHKETDSSSVSSVGPEIATLDIVGRDGCWQQLDTPCSILVPLSGTNRLHPAIHPVVDRRGLAESEKDFL